ncbi:MAG: OstA-like protein [Prolixibacteraceae bacterium]
MAKIHSYIKLFARIGLAGFLLFLISSGKTLAQQRKKVDIIHCDLLDHNARIIANAQRLLGNVQITVDGAIMWCDSLYSYTTSNTVDAFGHVHIVRGDTLNMYADFIHYDGETKLARARRNVKLIDKKITLTTDSLDYSMINDLASYNYSGTVKDSTNVLTSVVGLYYVNDRKALFKTDVDVVTKDYRIKSDTLIYMTETKKVLMEGPTYIFNEKDTLYSEFGWYDSMKGFAQLTKKPRIWNETRTVKADSIFYDKEKGEGLALGHGHIQDIENKIIVVGNRIQYNDISKIASATDSAMLIQYSETDSLFLHADRLMTMPDTTSSKKTKSIKKASLPNMNTQTLDSLTTKPLADDSLYLVGKVENEMAPDSLLSSYIKTHGLTLDSIKPENPATEKMAADSLSAEKKKDARLVLAWYKVRFFREDFQGKCDSLAYWSKDSTIQLFTDPVIWSNKNQITANYIEMINRSKDRDEVKMKDDAFIIAMEDDSIRFNQIKGKNMTGFIRQNNLEKIDVDGNGQSNYYARNQDGVIGLNKAESSNITIYLNKGKVKKIAFINKPEGELKPLETIDDGDKLLPGFNWQADIRPKNRDDIFRHPVVPVKEPAEPKAKSKVPPLPVKNELQQE